MERTLTKELVDQIVFGMENQEQDFFLDVERMEVVSDDEVSDQEEEVVRYVPIPEWQSIDGFVLMERFVQNLHNPLARTELHRILLSGRGVFRQFKDTLKQYPEIAKRWYRFKEKQMRSLVVAWWADLMEGWGLRFEEPEFDSTEELVLDDFEAFCGTLSDLYTATGDPGLPELLCALDAQGTHEWYDEAEERAVAVSRRFSARPGDDDLIAFLRTPAGDAAGFLWVAAIRTAEERRLGFVQQLYVVPEYRGLGAARTLVGLVSDRFESAGFLRVFWEIPVKADFLVPLVEKSGFTLGSRFYRTR